MSSPEPAGVVQLVDLIKRILSLSVNLAFVAFLLMLLWNGIWYLTSSGKSERIKKATEGVIWALLGLIFVAVAWLVLLLIKTFTGVDVTGFCFGFPGVATACL